jgi:uncharacterized cupredoxin-like copper-binding protein
MRNVLMPSLFGALLITSAMTINAAGKDDGHMHGGDAHHKAMNEHHGDIHEDMHKEMSGTHHGAEGGHGHHGDHGAHGAHGESLAGRPGQENEVSRTIEVEANDTMRFLHTPLTIKSGETIKFVVTNKGNIAHEFSIGTKDEHLAHGKMMLNNPGMHHGPGGPTVTVQPGKTETLIWYFEEAWQVEVACNIPGHYQAGMHSPVSFE